MQEGFGFSRFFFETRLSILIGSSPPGEEIPLSFGLYAIGFAILTIGLIYGAFLLHVPAHWIVVGAIVLLGLGILSGVKATRQRDSAA